jgi:tetratricopeptide (TPR) repeat protein
MNDSTGFATILREHMARAARTNHQLVQLTGIALRSIENWTSGKVRRLRLAADVLKLARALDLDALETNVLLRTTGHPPLDALRAQASQLADTSLQQLLATWPPPRAEPTEPHLASAIRHQLRPPVADFVGRETEAERLTTVLQAALEQGGGAVISGLHGMGGIGKTELAYLLAHRLRAALPDAQLVLNLRGSSAAPLSPAQALQTVIRALEPEVQLEADLEPLQARYRSALHGQRALLIADDAADAAQVRPLLPPQGCVLLVTSRVRFRLPGMLAIDLEVLAEDEAVALLRTLCERLGEADARALAGACGYLPLALRVSGSILQINPALSAAGYVRQLADERVRLAQLRDPDDPHLDVAASLVLSYARLDPAAQAVFRQLGVFVAPFSTELAPQVVVVPGSGVLAPELHGLLRHNLIIYDAERERWRLHDLVRDLARQQLEAACEWEEAQRRYARAAVALARSIQDQYQAGGLLGALAQFDAERTHIDAARSWAQERAETPDGDRLLLDIALATRLIGRLRYEPRQERLPLWEEARAAAQRLGDRVTEGSVLSNLGIAYKDLGELPNAIRAYEQSLAIAHSVGDRQSEGAALNNLGNVYNLMGEPSRAIVCFEQDLAISRELGDHRSERQSLGNLGRAYLLLGEIPKAIAVIKQRLAIARSAGDQLGEGTALLNLGLAYHCLGDFPLAVVSYEQSLAIARQLGDRQGEGVTLGNLSFTYSRLGEPRLALGHCEQALAINQAVGDRQSEGRNLSNLGYISLDLGDAERAIAACQASLAIARALGARREEAYALIYLARAEAAQGRLTDGDTSFARAVTLFQASGDRWSVAECRWLFGLALARQGQRERALPLLRAALAYRREIGHVQEAEQAAVLVRLEQGESLVAEPPGLQRLDKSAEKAEVNKVLPVDMPLSHKKLSESDQAQIS